MKLEEVNQRTKDAVDFLVAALESGHSEVLTAYLGAMAKFHTYSFGNIMLIARQKPDATNVAGLRTWNSLGRFVKRGEKGIFVLAPMVGKRSTKDVATDEPSERHSGHSGGKTPIRELPRTLRPVRQSRPCPCEIQSRRPARLSGKMRSTDPVPSDGVAQTANVTVRAHCQRLDRPN